MGLTKQSVGIGAIDSASLLNRRTGERLIALAGNPNVGKSTIFNALTGMKQHTGNWPGKTVAVASGRCQTSQNACLLVDIPGAYSLLAHSPEEEVARNFICFGEPDAVIVVCDATCLERNLNLALQILESGRRVMLCLNLMDEAKRRGLSVDLPLLSSRLGIPVVGVVARRKKSLGTLLCGLDALLDAPPPKDFRIPYPHAIECAVAILEAALDARGIVGLDSRWLALKLLSGEESLTEQINAYLGIDVFRDEGLSRAWREATEGLIAEGIDGDALQDLIASAVIQRAAALCRDTVKRERATDEGLACRLDRLLTGKWTAYPIMLLFLAAILFLTVTVSSYPSQWLSTVFQFILSHLSLGLRALHTPPWLHGLLVDGMLGVLFRVISVMLPPMAIFFPLFTILEDSGYLPRIAYNLDRPFQRCRACGKQALTMCMGFGCNAAGVVGCRIIDSPRERLLAILTNSLVPCNGRFPALIALIAMFFAGTSAWIGLYSTLILCGCILAMILLTLLVTRLLSTTILRGLPSAFTLELPPFRSPEVGRVILRSVFDRTLFVLGRAIAVAAPAGVVIWILANVTAGDISLLGHVAAFLDPFARLLGMDGVILTAFILGFPANEIVIPIIFMAYLSLGAPVEINSMTEMRSLLVANGWTWATAVSVLIFMLLHWPCSTTLLTVKKETGSIRWTLLAAAVPTALGILICMLFTAAVSIFAG